MGQSMVHSNIGQIESSLRHDDCPEASGNRRLRKGTCRVCFKGDGELIAPCYCKGTSKWIHRDCLNHWRASGSNPRALTHCCECGFRYHLKLQKQPVIEEKTAWQKFMQPKTFAIFGAIQIAIVCFGLIAHALDVHQYMVALFHFPEEHRDHKAGSILDFLCRHHVLTYYITGLISAALALAIAGISTVVVPPIVRNPYLGSILKVFDCCMFIFAISMALKTAVVDAQKMKGLAEEYLVEDLAEPDDYGEEIFANEDEQAIMHQRIEQDIKDILGSPARAPFTATEEVALADYGSTVSNSA